MSVQSLSTLLLLAALSALGACSSGAQNASSAFSLPIDFSYACEGAAGHTVPPDNDETAASISSTRMCPDVESGVQGDLFGVVLDRLPPQLLVMNINPASGNRRLIDTDFFIPGITGISVGKGPLRVLRAPDWSAFYVVSASDRRVDRIVLERLDDDGILSFSQQSFELPDTPIEAEVIGTDLLIAARDQAELWRYDLAADPVAPPLSVISLPDRLAHVIALDQRWLVTWRTRRTVTLMEPDGTIISEAGLTAQCRDGLDNDGDGLTDDADIDCSDAGDDDEGDATGAERTAPPAVAASYDGTPSCSNGIDDDEDGATDYPEDLACADSEDDGELAPECSDGIDQDGDGLTDLDDETCYAAWGNHEGQLPADGPFHPTLVDAGEYGRFVYVLDERVGEILVFDVSDGGFARVDVNAEDTELPALESVPFGEFDDEPDLDHAVDAIRPPAHRARGLKNIRVTSANMVSLSNQRLRGELWSRIIAPENPGEAPSVSLTPNSALWKPAVCAPTPTDRCQQPDLDDATWYAFGANLDGRIQLVEAIRRGMPVHRLAERVRDPSLRRHDTTAPRLTRRGTLINARGEPQPKLPFIGAALEEVLEERVPDETPERFRRFGIWPPSDFEETPSETWIITYQGRIPEANGVLGSLVEATRFVDPRARFCEAGVQPGDLLQLEVPVESADPSLQHTLEVVTSDGVTCPTREQDLALVELTIEEVGMTSLTLDATGAVLRPRLPVLDEEAIGEQRISLRACRDALETIDEELGLPDNLATHEGVEPGDLPRALGYSVRGSSWIFVGGDSGFLHRQRWDRETASCVVDEDLDERLTGRSTEVPDAVSKYEQCPPGASQLQEDTVEEIAPASGRFYNPSFGVDIFPACETTSEGEIVHVPSQQDTALSFIISGPHSSSSLSVSDAVAITRVPLLDFRRQQVQLDVGLNRASILQLRIGNPDVIAVFD